MSLTFIRTEPSYYALFDGHREVGWLSRQAIGLCGFATAEEARNAGRAAERSLARWLEMRPAAGGQLLPTSPSTEWSPEVEVEDFGVPPPVYGIRRCGLSRSYAFEIPLPAATRLATAVHAVQALYGNLHSPSISLLATHVGADVGSVAA
jgi:hypothetical protein